MDESLQSAFDAMGREAEDLMDEVEKALEEHAAFSFMLATRARVEDVSRRYHEAVARLDEKARFGVDRTLGRKVSDLQKLATRLPSPPAGNPAEKRRDTGFFETRAPSSSRPPTTPGLAPGEQPRDRTQAKVTDEIEAWCGRCMSLRAHIIAAMVGDQPAQVVCTFCRSSSRFREGPARVAKKSEPRAGGGAKPTAATRVRDEKEKEQAALIEALRNAENVRPFSPKERYKAGEIIEHPELGRGKIENTLPRSLLVRFASGLKPLKLS
jgi:hypothetical protein